MSGGVTDPVVQYRALAIGLAKENQGLPYAARLGNVTIAQRQIALVDFLLDCQELGPPIRPPAIRAFPTAFSQAVPRSQAHPLDHCKPSASSATPAHPESCRRTGSDPPQPAPPQCDPSSADARQDGPRTLRRRHALRANAQRTCPAPRARYWPASKRSWA